MPAPDLWRMPMRRLLPDRGGVPDADLLARFRDARDAAAFELLVYRHGPLVWAACRRLLGEHHAAEDAFQATFLAPARRAGSIRRPTLSRPGCTGSPSGPECALPGAAVRSSRTTRTPRTRLPGPPTGRRPPTWPTTWTRPWTGCPSGSAG